MISLNYLGDNYIIYSAYLSSVLSQVILTLFNRSTLCNNIELVITCATYIIHKCNPYPHQIHR